VPETNSELSILHRLAQASPPRPESKYVLTFLDSFEHQGPNGTHSCLVLPLMGPGVTNSTMVKRFPSIDRPLGSYPKPIAKEISRQILLGTDYLHQNGIVHTGRWLLSISTYDVIGMLTPITDIHAGNVLFALPDLSSLPETELERDLVDPVVSKPVKRQDGKIDRWAPQYLAVPQPLTSRVCMDSELTVRISDMGGG
jgi:hypothetical protein